MEMLSFESFEAHVEDYDVRVAAQPGIDAFCSSSSWVLPAALGLMPPRQPLLFRDERGYALFALSSTENGFRVLEPLEASWCFSCPLIGTADLLHDVLRHLGSGWDICALPGIAESSPLFGEVVRTLAPHYGLQMGESTLRLRASLEGGMEAFLGRRSRTFRDGLGKAVKRARTAGVSFVADSGCDGERLYARILRVDERTWKGRGGSSLQPRHMRDFYRLMLRRLAETHAHRVLFAQFEGQDIGYMLGGVLNGAYRGQQFGFDDSYSRFSIGNLLQLEQIGRLCEEGILRYDLGSDVEYKRRWAEGGFETAMLLILNPTP